MKNEQNDLMKQKSGQELPNGKLIGTAVSRVDGRLKVTGAARYSAEIKIPNLAYGMVLPSRIAAGRIKSIDANAAAQAAGFIGILTHENAPDLRKRQKKTAERREGLLANRPDQGLAEVLQDNSVYYRGQSIALVVAETLEQAEHAAALVRVEYEETDHETDLEANLNKGQPPIFNVVPVEEPADSRRGEPETALKNAAAHVNQTYITPIVHHHPLEPHATVAVWEAENKLTLYDSNQGPIQIAGAVAAALGLAKENVRVLTKFVGGGFGNKLRPWNHVILAALAARMFRRPVKVVLTRQQMVTMVGYRSKHVQDVNLGAERDGRLTGIFHRSTSQNSMFDEYAEAVVTTTRKIYACPNVATETRLVRLNVPTPTSLRSPGKSSGMFALESALDEMAFDLKIDPLELRLKNYAERDPDHDLPFSSKKLKECYLTGAEKIGWKNRRLEPRKLRRGNFLVGMGMATATYPAYRSEASARVIVRADGTATVQTAATDIGVGTYTSMTLIAADALQLPLEKVKFELGDSSFPFAPLAGGSRTTATVGAAVRAACLAAIAKILELAAKNSASPLYGLTARDVTIQNEGLFDKYQPKKRESYRDILRRAALDQISVETRTAPDEEFKKYSAHSFGANFVEVEVDADLGTVRVRRFVGVYDAGQIISEKTARSQLLGGVIWGIGHALMEESVIDHRAGGFVTRSLADYHFPSHADIPAIEIDLIADKDLIVNELGARGIGELSIVGTAAAVANAVFNATGRRIRNLPITPDKLI